MIEISHKVVSDIASLSLEERTVAHFLNQLAEDEKNHFVIGMNSKAGKISIRSLFGLNTNL